MANKPGGFFGPPSRFAHEAGPDDGLDDGDVPDAEEQDAEGDNEERPPDVLTTIYHGLSSGEDKAAHVAMGIAQCLQQMVHSASRDDREGLGPDTMVQPMPRAGR
jgi:hypothetical protein